MAKPRPGRQEITVILPPEPPKLTPGAARALLKILLKAYEEQFGPDNPVAPKEDEPDESDSQDGDCSGSVILKARNPEDRNDTDAEAY